MLRNSVFNKIDEEDQKNESRLFSKIGKLIRIIDDLRDVGLNKVFSLPRICVLGTQSAGKSSVLESIIGLDCLPRGDGLVTRRPLELRLVHISYKDQTKPWAEFEELKGQKFEDFEEVKQKINFLTDKMAGKNKGIINIPIKLTIYSNTCPDLTVIDLPGITRIPYKGSDQPDNIEEITRDMCKIYCGDPATIILCVVQANVDLSTSEGLKMAKELDPKGERTIGVLTKIDLMDHGTNCKSMVTGADIPLKHGYIALKNRSKHDLDQRITIQEALKNEKEFFRSHPVYMMMDNSYFGTENLVEKLQKIFLEHLKLFLPGIFNDLKEKMKECQTELNKIGYDYNLSNSENKFSFLNQLINQFSENVERSFAGKLSNIEENTISHEIKTLYYSFLEDYQNDYDPSTNFSTNEIIELVKLTEGDRLGGFPQNDVIFKLLSNEVETLRQETKSLLEKIYDKSIIVVKNSQNRIFKRFPKLLTKIEELTQDFIDENFKTTKLLCEDISEMNFNYLYLDEKNMSTKEVLDQVLVVHNTHHHTSHDDHLSDTRETNISSKDYYTKLAGYIKLLINHFYQLMVRNLREYVPKSISYNYIRSLKQQMKFYLLKEVNGAEESHEFLAEDPEIAKRREFYSNLYNTMRAAEKVMLADESIKSLIKYQKDNPVLIKRESEIHTIPTNFKNKVDNIKEIHHRNSIRDKKIPQKVEEKHYFNKIEENKNESYEKNAERKQRSDQIISSNTASENYNNTKTQTTKQNIQYATNNLNEKPEPSIDFNIKYDPKANEIKGINVKADIDYETAKKIYQDNKHLLPSKEQTMSGAKSTVNFVKSSGILENMNEPLKKEQPINKTKTKIDPLQSFFGKSVTKKGEF